MKCLKCVFSVVYILLVYSLFSDRVGLPLHNTPFPGVLMKSIGATFFRPDALPDVLVAFQSMFISIWVSRLEIDEFPDCQCSRVSRANEEMLDIMRRRAAVCTDVEACILLDSALVRAQESTIS